MRISNFNCVFRHPNFSTQRNQHEIYEDLQQFKAMNDRNLQDNHCLRKYVDDRQLWYTTDRLK